MKTPLVLYEPTAERRRECTPDNAFPLALAEWHAGGLRRHCVRRRFTEPATAASAGSSGNWSRQKPPAPVSPAFQEPHRGRYGTQISPQGVCVALPLK